MQENGKSFKASTSMVMTDGPLTLPTLSVKNSVNKFFCILVQVGQSENFVVAFPLFSIEIGGLQPQCCLRNH